MHPSRHRHLAVAVTTVPPGIPLGTQVTSHPANVGHVPANAGQVGSSHGMDVNKLPDDVETRRPDVSELLQQIMSINEQSLDEAQAR